VIGSRLVAAWNDFFFREQSPLPVCCFRILFGTMVAATLVLMRPDWLAWYGPRAWLSLATMHLLEPGSPLNVLAYMPQTNAWINGFFWLFLASSLCLACGFLTRLNSVIVFIGLNSMDQRNLYILHGGDTFLRVASFFLMFAPAGAALSVDHLIRVPRGKEGNDVTPRAPWAQRMIQYQLAILYFSTFCWKLKGHAWLNGTALYYVYHLDEMQRFPVPSLFLKPMVLKLASWAALALEFSLGVLIWVKRLRYWLLGLGLLFHLFLEYSLNVPLFEWDVLTAYVLFIEPGDLSRALSWLRRHTRLAHSNP
jgi:hypothetical protein